MTAVVLKGFKNCYALIIKSEASFEQVLVELTELLKKLHDDTKSTKPVAFNVNTKQRLLTAEQKQQLEKVFSVYPQFSIHKILADVITVTDAQEIMHKNMTHFCADVIRNGQIKTIDGDVLFLGCVHQGGILQAKGSIFVLGDVQGILHAGYKDDTRAVIVGKIKDAQQVRIADLVDVLEDETVVQDEDNVVYVNDLHDLAHTQVVELKNLRPKLFAQMGGF